MVEPPCHNNSEYGNTGKMTCIDLKFCGLLRKPCINIPPHLVSAFWHWWSTTAHSSWKAGRPTSYFWQFCVLPLLLIILVLPSLTCLWRTPTIYSNLSGFLRPCVKHIQLTVSSSSDQTIFLFWRRLA